MCFPGGSFCFVQFFKLLTVIRNKLLFQLLDTLEVLCLQQAKKYINELPHAFLCGFCNHKWTINTQLTYLAYFNDIQEKVPVLTA